MGIIKDVLSGTGRLVGEAVIEEQQRREDEAAYEAANKAAKRERDRLTYSAVRAFIDLDADNETIYDLLDKYFKVSAISEARKLTKNARVDSQYEKVREYKLSQGMTRRDFLDYATDIGLEDKLKNDPKLLTASTEKLIATLEKKK